jgi:rubrerythrin
MDMDQHKPILAALADSDPELTERLVDRRAAIKAGATVSGAVAAGLRMASVPVALAAVARDAFGQTRLPAVVINVLNYALLLEEFETAFYSAAVNSGIIPGADLPVFTRIRDNETAHRNFLRTTLGASARPAPAFDFTGGGAYPTILTNYQTFLAAAQAFEDNGVRAYKGQAPALMPYKDVLTAALTIHSVEARHASEVRRLRHNFDEQEPFSQGWINLANTDVPGPAAAVYQGEDNTVHAGIDAAGLTYNPPVARDEITEAFDEPLTQAQVLAIVSRFIAA